MIKILIKESKIISENLKYPKDIFEKIKIISDKLFNSNIHSYETQIQASFKDILGIDSPLIKNGLVFYATLNDLGFETLPEKILTMWNNQTFSFDEKFLEKIKNVSFSLRLTIKEEGEKARVNISTITKGDKKISRLGVQLNNKLLHSLGENQRNQAIKHELRHIFSQLIPSMCLEYGRDLKSKKDPKLVKKIKQFSDKSHTGIGSSPLKISAIPPEEVGPGGIERHKAIDTYLISDDEFEIWMSDLVAFYTDWLSAQRFITKKIIKSSSAEDIAVKYASKLIRDVEFRKRFSRANEEYEIYFRFINQMLQNRQEEFTKKLLRYLTAHIKEKYPA